MVAAHRNSPKGCVAEVIWPERFPFDILDPQPDLCPGCGCPLADPDRKEDCQQPQCTCHELLNREEWGDR